MISVIIPAHNEGSVIARTLKAMTEGAGARELEVIVVCNGCDDDTAAVARRFSPNVRVIETKIASKSNALNLGDQAACGSPRIYSDADVVITLEAIRILARRLERGDVLVVAPTPRFDLAGCSWLVRAWFDIRSYLPSSREGIGGSGVYALSAAGRARFREFPPVTADDGYVRIQFLETERETVPSAHSTVFPPRTVKHLISTKTRSHYGSFELAQRFPEGWKRRGESNNRMLFRLCRKPVLWPKLAVYCMVMIIAKRRARIRLRSAIAGWERDNTSRATA
jgi:glycosyltransferase involved in cell wall biosynthesis